LNEVLTGEQYETTMIHGRFQPFHIGHFCYLKRALSLTKERLIVGITNPHPSLIKKEYTDNHRHLADTNPFTYFNRQTMIRDSILLDYEVKDYFHMIHTVPFPIHDEELWAYYIPPDTVQIVNILEKWDNVKKSRFEKFGYRVHVLNDPRIASGTMIRKRLKEKMGVDEFVPEGTRRYLRSFLNSG
jgi:cytidyltransferase-like protein